jgi:vesicle coat complex subunit
MEYTEIPDFDNDTLAKLNSADQDVVMLTILSIVERSGNYDLAIKVTRQFLDHDNEYIRGIAIECISHIGRLWNKLPVDLIEKANNALFGDPSGWVRDKADDVVDDLEVFIKGYERPSK